ncbi:MAG: SGNH/GDSL hydrolase family protein, partial [Ilumatobacteraceae bacterium]
PVRIVVAGDSTAEASGVGLVTWAAANPELAQVDIEAAPGCGFVRGGDVLVDENWRPVPDRCEGWLDDVLPGVAATASPDVVMLKTTSWDVLDHRWEPGEQFSPLDPELRAAIERDFATVTDRLLDEGVGTVAWVMQPVPNPLWLDLGQTQSEPERHQVLYATMRELAAERPGRVEVVDLAGWLDATGYATDADLRPDGVHWTPEASTRLADEYLGEQLVRVALGLPRP